MERNINEKELWEKAAAFHGHVCGGLTIGYKAALYAIELLGRAFSEEEDVVCISENDAGGCHPGDLGLQRGKRKPFVSYAWETGVFFL